MASIAPCADASGSPAFVSSSSRRDRETAFTLRVMRIAAPSTGRELIARFRFSARRTLFSRVVTIRRDVMRPAMHAFRDQFQIVGGVVRSIAVAMMHLFVVTKRTPDQGRHDHAMLEGVCPRSVAFDPDLAITVRSEIPGHGRIVANRRVYARESK